MTTESPMLEACPFCGVRPERLKNLDFSDSEAFWHPDDASVCILNGCSIHRDKWDGWNKRARLGSGAGGVREALKFAHDKLVEHRVASICIEARYGGTAKIVSEIVNKTRAALSTDTGSGG